MEADINTLTLQKISYLDIHLQDRSAPLKEKEASRLSMPFLFGCSRSSRGDMAKR
jgi:hypothetical protein